MRIAVVGAGVSGLVAARELASHHEVHLFEAAPKAGGHACTVRVEEEGRSFPVDLGFIVYNRRNYPHFCRLLDALGVETTASSMGFSVQCPETGFEYSGEGLAGLLAGGRNLFSGRFWRMVGGVARFLRAGREELAGPHRRSLGDFCLAHRVPEATVRDFVLPMAGAIWSTPRLDVLDFPARSLLAFFRQHGLLSLTGRPRWRTVVGGSERYVQALLSELPASIHLATPVQSVQRTPRGIQLMARGQRAIFDEIVLAVHSDTALRLLVDPSPAERQVLGAVRYRNNDAVLHCDRGLLPRRRVVWSSWNVALQGRPEESIPVTYLMNKLQPLPTETPWCVTLNRTDQIDPGSIRHQVGFSHPQFDAGALRAQERWAEISGVNHTHYCGAYWRHGFHEDGTWSGIRAARALRRRLREVA